MGDHCPDHSGLVMWAKINAALLSLALALLSYSSFVQVPNLRYDIAKDINRLNSRLDGEFKLEVQAMKDRLAHLEAETPH